MSEPVYLRVYDLSDGVVRVWSPVLLGKRIDGIWHTGIALYGMEYFYGGKILRFTPADVEQIYKITPYRVHQLGTTKVTREEFERYLTSIRVNFSRQCYDLIKWNCNNFTDHVSRYLLERGIPGYILDLPDEILNTFLGKIVINFIKMFSDAPAVDSEAASHPKQTLAFPPTFNRSGRRSSCPGSPLARRRSASSDPFDNLPRRNRRMMREQRLTRPEQKSRLGRRLDRSLNPASAEENQCLTNPITRRRKLNGCPITRVTHDQLRLKRSSVPTLSFESLLPDGQATSIRSEKNSSRSVSNCSLIGPLPPRPSVSPGENKIFASLLETR